MRGFCTAAAVLLAGLHAVSATITGTEKCNKARRSLAGEGIGADEQNICVTVRHDDVALTDTYTLAPPSGSSIPVSNFGWMSLGWGQQMANSPMIVVWPNSDGSITLSHRIASGNKLPSVQSSPSRVASLNTTQTFANSTSTEITFTLPSQSGASDSALNATEIIWAVSSSNPGSSSESASFRQHDSAGTMTLALLASLSGSSTSGGSASASGSSASASSSSGSGGTAGTSNASGESSASSGPDKVLVAHAVLGGLAAMIFLPLGVLIPRLARGLSLNRWWFPAHSVVVGIIGGALVVATWALAQKNFGDDNVGETHANLGLVLFILVLGQVALGVIVHWWKRSHKFQTKSGRGPLNFLHIILGIAIVVIGWVTVWTGMRNEWPRFSGDGPLGVGYTAAWGALVGIFALLYLAGVAFLLPRQRKMERIARESKLGGAHMTETR